MQRKQHDLLWSKRTLYIRLRGHVSNMSIPSWSRVNPRSSCTRLKLCLLNSLSYITGLSVVLFIDPSCPFRKHLCDTLSKKSVLDQLKMTANALERMTSLRDKWFLTSKQLILWSVCIMQCWESSLSQHTQYIFNKCLVIKSKSRFTDSTSKSIPLNGIDLPCEWIKHLNWTNQGWKCSRRFIAKKLIKYCVLFWEI